MATYLLVLAGVGVAALAVLAFAVLRVSRSLSTTAYGINRALGDAAGSLASLDEVARYIARVVITQPKPPAEERAYLGALLEFGEDGLPWRMSVSPRSPFYFPTQAVVKLDGVPVERCLEADRAAGWVQCEDEMGQALPRRFGRVEVSVG